MGKKKTAVIDTDYQCEKLCRALRSKPRPYLVTIEDGKPRSYEQNKLQFLWLNEIVDQKGDDTVHGYRAMCKLEFGVPILLRENKEYAHQWNLVMRDLPYEIQLMSMLQPMDFPVTRCMTTKQKQEFLDKVFYHYTGEGVVLTKPLGG